MTAFEKLCEIVAKLRAPGGCPWDREQTHESLLPALIEEAYESPGALRANDSANLREELGDMLLLIVMHAEIANESDRFDINGVLKDVTEKLIRRHPHVFGSSDARDSGAVLRQWESIKRAEKAGKPGRNAGDAGGTSSGRFAPRAPCSHARAKSAVESCPCEFRLARSARRDRKG